MKCNKSFRILLIALLVGFTFLSTYSQNALDRKIKVLDRTDFERNPPFSINDTTIDVVYSNNQKNGDIPACFIDSVLVDLNTVTWINPIAVSDIKVIKRDTTIGSRHFKHQLVIKTHDTIHVNLMSLSEIRSKYTKPSSNKAIFVLKNRLSNKNDFITDDQRFRIDRNYIFRIIVDQMNLADPVQNEPIPIDVIRILFRTQENIDEANQIMIRGTDTVYPSSATDR